MYVFTQLTAPAESIFCYIDKLQIWFGCVDLQNVTLITYYIACFYFIIMRCTTYFKMTLK
jgi:hypothetical protein